MSPIPRSIAHRIVWLCSDVVIRSFRHKGIERFYRTGSTSGIQAIHSDKLRKQPFKLDHSSKPTDMDVPGWRLHRLKGALKGHCSVWVDSHWRVTFSFENGDAVLVDYQQYH